MKTRVRAKRSDDMITIALELGKGVDDFWPLFELEAGNEVPAAETRATVQGAAVRVERLAGGGWRVVTVTAGRAVVLVEGDYVNRECRQLPGHPAELYDQRGTVQEKRQYVVYDKSDPAKVVGLKCRPRRENTP
jgi:hypothetical protein